MNKSFIIFTSILFLFLYSCNDWLDITPLGQADDDKMFQNDDGFHQVLAGSYSLLTSDSVYGTELTIGFPEEIVRYWNKRSEFYDFNYADADAAARISGTWNKMYEIIANLNLLLDHAKDRNESNLENYNLIVGEAKGLRAYLHLDLLQLFGPVLKDGLNQPSIPYREEFSNKITKRLSADEVIKKIKTDLEDAYQLLKNDPIKQYGRRDTTTDTRPENNAFAYRYRGLRMNYYAVCATLARVHLLSGDKVKALKYAQEIIDASHIFKLLERSEMIEKGPDLMFQSEIIWGVYDTEIKTHISDKLAYARYNIDANFKNYVYYLGDGYGLADDYRNSYWWERTTTTPAYDVLKKYKRNIEATGYDATYWDRIIGMIRLSEVYYIAAEANIGTNNAEALRLLTAVRTARNVSRELPANLPSNEAVLEQVVYEYLKEFWGEGKLFYTYKRLFHPIIVRSSTIPPSKAIFEIPIPKNEIEHGGNE